MFAVPGWSIAAEGPKAETEAKKPKPEGAAPNKRKRATKKKDEAVNEDNVANMWERVIEGKVPKPKSGSEKKRERKAKAKARDEAKPAEEQQKEKRSSRLQDEAGKPAAKKQKAAAKLEDEVEAEAAPEEDDQAWGGFSDDEAPAAKEDEEDEAPPKKKAKKEKKKEKKAKAETETETETASPAKSPALAKTTTKAAATAKAAAPAPAPAPAPAAPKLTPLQASMRAKLVSARFRHLNETLYTRPSADALQLFTDSPEMFSEYHEGFRRQVEVWPENPVDGYIRDIKARGKVKPPSRDPRKPQKPHQETDQIVSLPRTDGTATIADLGCGDARLAEVLTPLAKKLRLALHSFDLHSPSPLVTRADIANVPLADGAADVAIFCLALMGTNWLDFIEEAYRILRWKGELWIAEIKSRFAGKAALTAAAGSRVVEHSVGNRKKQQAVGKKAAKPTAAEVAAEGEDLAIEVDGADDRRNETDLSAFVEALRKRGFVLQAEDMSNRMFVRMIFVKSAPPTKGKGVEAAKAREAAKQAAMGGDRNKKQKRFVWEDKDNKEEEEGIDETAILKPCVYKLR